MTPLADPNDTIAYATIALAAVGGLAFFANLWLALMTNRVATASHRAADAAYQQLALARLQGRPHVRAGGWPADDGNYGLTGDLIYVSGASPAFEPRVLLVVGNQKWHTYLDEALFPHLPKAKYRASFCDPGDFDSMPVPGLPKQCHKSEGIIAVSWNAEDGTAMWWRRRYRWTGSHWEAAEPEEHGEG
jgi:hypothetical protein